MKKLIEKLYWFKFINKCSKDELETHLVDILYFYQIARLQEKQLKIDKIVSLLIIELTKGI